MKLTFEWDSLKAEANFRKHDISFQEASTVLMDPVAVTAYDPDHSDDELRFLTMGTSDQGRLLVVVHTDRGNRIRLISARKATTFERKDYEEGP